MTLALGRKANAVMPTYATGCKRGHEPLRFRGDIGCFRCGRTEWERTLSEDQLARLARKTKAHAPTGLTLLDEAVAQTALKLRALALLEDIDIENPKQYGGWLKLNEQVEATVDQRLRKYDEAEVRWAVKAAYV